MRVAREQRHCLIIAGDLFERENFFQLLLDLRLGNLFKIELQAARLDGHWNFLRISFRQNKFDMSRRLFERLQHRVERIAREHVHFVDNVNLEPGSRRRVQRAF